MCIEFNVPGGTQCITASFTVRFCTWVMDRIRQTPQCTFILVALVNLPFCKKIGALLTKISPWFAACFCLNLNCAFIAVVAIFLCKLEKGNRISAGRKPNNCNGNRKKFVLLTGPWFCCSVSTSWSGHLGIAFARKVFTLEIPQPRQVQSFCISSSTLCAFPFQSNHTQWTHLDQLSGCMEISTELFRFKWTTTQKLTIADEFSPQSSIAVRLVSCRFTFVGGEEE